MTHAPHPPCSALRDRDLICANGFVQTGACRGHACLSCGRMFDTLPWCLREDLPARYIKEDGSPAFYRTLSRRADGAAS